MLTSLILHLGNDEIVCVPWRFGRPQGEVRFACSGVGFSALTNHLRDWQNVPTRILVDLIEEDFRVETLPHLRRGDRAQVIARRLGQLYRATPFRAAVIQGREASGRRDDIALFTAITQNDSLVACLDALGHWRIPVLGVYPAAALGEPLLRALKVDIEQLVLVTRVSAGALRISFFQHGRLKFSRISQPVPDANGSIAAELREEMRRTLQYVGSQAWFLRGAPVRTLLIADGDDAKHLSANWQDNDSPLQVIAPQAVARRLGARFVPAHSNATGLLMHLLMQARPAEQLAPRERTQDGRLWQVRRLLFSASALTALVALVLAGSDVLGGLTVREDSTQLAAALQARDGEIAAAQAQLPSSSMSPDRMSALVRFHRNEVLAVPKFVSAMQSLSRALEGSPGLQLRRLHWRATAQRPPAPNGEGAPPAPTVGRSEGSVLTGLMPRPWFQDLRIEGEVSDPAAEQGTAVAAVEALAGALRRPGLDVGVIRPPFDLDPRHALSSSSMELPGRKPEFVIRVSGTGAP